MRLLTSFSMTNKAFQGIVTQSLFRGTRGFESELLKVRERGYATDDEEYIRGVRAVACPLEADSLPHAMWVVGFSRSLDNKKMGRVIDELGKTSHFISEALRT
jgi:DNA-binding IclR family transcriptional regulator